MARRKNDPKPEETQGLPQSEGLAEGDAERVSFDAWFQQAKAADPKRKEWHREMLRAFMKDQGLSEREEKKLYEKALSRF